MSTHTPGPWEYVPDDGTGTLPAVLSAHVNAGGNFYVAQCNVDADAHLIAAAPELLEALKACVSWIETVEAENADCDFHNPHIPAELRDARAAIAKIEGR